MTGHRMSKSNRHSALTGATALAAGGAALNFVASRHTNLMRSHFTRDCLQEAHEVRAGLALIELGAA
jgi:hypothetical protein